MLDGELFSNASQNCLKRKKIHVTSSVLNYKANVNKIRLDKLNLVATVKLWNLHSTKHQCYH